MGPISLQNLQLDGALIGTFWKLPFMFWLNYICALRQFLCKIILLKWITEVPQRFPYNQANTIAWKFSRLSGNFPDYLETFQNIWKLSRLSKNFPDYPETFQSVRKTFQTFRKLSRQSGNFLTYSTVHASFNGHFFIYAQKLSGRAKTFRSAMLTRWRGFWDSALKYLEVPWII